jgi:hypothetical protein
MGFSADGGFFFLLMDIGAIMEDVQTGDRVTGARVDMLVMVLDRIVNACVNGVRP